MNKVYTIFEKATGFPVDVIAELTLCIFRVNELENNNPSIEFDYRIATIQEQNNAHIIQIDASQEFETQGH